MVLGLDNININTEFLTVQEACKNGILRARQQALSNTQKCNVQRDTCADKARELTGKGHPMGEQQAGAGTQENCSAAGLPAPGFTAGA